MDQYMDNEKGVLCEVIRPVAVEMDLRPATRAALLAFYEIATSLSEMFCESLLRDFGPETSIPISSINMVGALPRSGLQTSI